MTNAVTAKPKKRRRASSLDKKKARGGWIFVLPFVIGFVLIYLPIVIDSIRYTFYTAKPISQTETMLIPAGWTYYNQALREDPTFVQTLLEGLQQLVFDIPMILIFSLFMAVLLNQKMAGRAAFRAIFFIPVILSTGIMETVAGGALEEYMSSNEGINDGSGESASNDIVSAVDIKKLFGDMAVGEGLVKYVTDAVNNIFNIVNRSGVQILIFLSGLQSISPAIYESVQIDGATAWETFWKITFPMISPMILVNAVYTVIDSFTTDTNKVMTAISQAYEGGSKELSSAMAWIYFLIVIVAIAVVAGICSAFVFYQRKD